MKTVFFENALKLSAVELDEVIKIREHLSKIFAKDFKLNHVSVGFEQFKGPTHLEVSVYANFTDYNYKIEHDGTTYVHTCLDLILVGKEVGEILLDEIKERRQNNKYIDLRLLL